MGTVYALALSLLAIFLILLVLVQRGRGGGLSGALGGVGGSSAFGAKAGDVFTKITIGATAVWIFLCVMAAYWAGHRGDALGEGDAALGPGGVLSAPLDDAPADGDAAGTNAPTGETSGAATETGDEAAPNDGTGDDG